MLGTKSLSIFFKFTSPRLLGLQELKPIINPLNLSVLSKGLLFLKETEYVRGLKYN